MRQSILVTSTSIGTAIWESLFQAGSGASTLAENKLIKEKVKQFFL